MTAFRPAERVMISVTADDIAEGRPEHPALCPVALAVKRTIGIEEVLVDIGGSSDHIELDWSQDDSFTLNDALDGEPWKAAYAVEPWVIAKLESYDNGANLRPFEFEMRLVEEDGDRSPI